MIIRQAEIQKFGKLEKEQYRFSPQINIIYGPNESGKSTLMQFLKAMMYGLEKSRVRKMLDTYKKYEPWDAPAYFSGSMIFETGEQQFLLERNFYYKERSTRLVNIRDGEELSVEYGDLDMLLGNVSAGAYENTFCIGQEQSVPGRELGVLLEDERSNLAQTGSGDFPLSKALQNLEQKRKNKEKQKKEHILVCLSSSPSNEKIIRTAAQMAQAFQAGFTALYVQTAEKTEKTPEDLARLQKHVRLAEQSGAEIVTTHSEDIALQIAEYARISEVTRIVIGKSMMKQGYFHQRRVWTERLTDLVPDLEIHIIPDSDVYRRYQKRKKFLEWMELPSWKELMLTVLILAAATGIGEIFFRLGFTDANIITVYLFGVMLTSILTSGYTCSVISSVASVILFNYFMTEPRLSLYAYGSGYPVTFAIMLGTSILTSTLALKLKENAKLSARDAFRTKILFNTSQLLQKAEDASEIFDITATQLIKLLGRNLVVAPVEKKKNGIVQGTLYNAETGIKSEKVFNVKEQEILQWVLKNRKRAGAMTERFSEEPYLYLSIYAAQNRYGVIGIFIGQKPLDAFENSILLSILGECAMALDREQSAREKEEAAVMAKNEQLRVNLLRTISHDLRTPLTSILGNADSLISNFDALDEGMRKQIFSDIYEDAGWLIELVENLLALTKIEDGSVKLQLSDQVVEDVVREALRHVERRKNEHKITVDCGEDVLLARMDAKLIVQVLVNLINNAVKYTQTGSKIRITAGKEEKNVWIAVEDNGPGIPAECREHVFEMFYSGKNKVSDSRRSLGLGLALCRSIVNAHGGELVLRDCAPHGCHFRFTLPLSEVNLNE